MSLLSGTEAFKMGGQFRTRQRIAGVLRAEGKLLHLMRAGTQVTGNHVLPGLGPRLPVLSCGFVDMSARGKSFKQQILSVPLLLMAEEVSLETEKEVLAHGVDAVFPKQDDPTALALHVRALYDLMGNRGEGQS